MAPGMRVNWRVTSRFREYGLQSHKAIESAVNAVLADGAREAAAKAPRRRGTLAGSIGVEKAKRTARGYRGAIFSQLVYARRQEWTHARRSRFLRKGLVRAKNGFVRELKARMPK